MKRSTQNSALARLLTLNNRVHDLERLLAQMDLSVVGIGPEAHLDSIAPNQIADIQREIDREARASLVTCWLGMPFDREE